MSASRAVSAAVAREHVRQRLALAYGQRIPGEGHFLVDLSSAPRELLQAECELLQAEHRQQLPEQFAYPREAARGAPGVVGHEALLLQESV